MKYKTNTGYFDYDTVNRLVEEECILYAVAYNINNDTLDVKLKQKPIQGKIVKTGTNLSWRSYAFIPINKKGELRKTGQVAVLSRHYTDTLKEAVELYNELVTKRIQYLEAITDAAKKDFISISDFN